MFLRPALVAILLGASVIHFSLLVLASVQPAMRRRFRAAFVFFALCGIYLLLVAAIMMSVRWHREQLRIAALVVLIASRFSLVELALEVSGMARFRNITRALAFIAAAPAAGLILISIKGLPWTEYQYALYADGVLSSIALVILVSHARSALMRWMSAGVFLILTYVALQAFARPLIMKGGGLLAALGESATVGVALVLAYHGAPYVFVEKFLRYGIAAGAATGFAVLAGSLLITTDIAPSLITLGVAGAALLAGLLVTLLMDAIRRRSDRSTKMRERILQLMASTPAASAGAAIADILRWGFDSTFADYTSAAAPPPRGEVRLEIPVQSASRDFGLFRMGVRRHDAPYEPYDTDWLRSIAAQLATMLERDEAARREIEMRELASRAEVSALRAQIQPHFLFNCLNTLADLVKSDPAAAEQLIEQMAEIFRYTLAASRSETVSLSEEMAFIAAYLEIEKARFQERLRVEIAIADDVHATRIPPMTIQPIVENAIRHGISRSRLGGSVRIHAAGAGERVHIEIRDAVQGSDLDEPRSGLGIALENVRKRLDLLFRGGASLSMDFGERGTCVTIEVPRAINGAAVPEPPAHTNG
ncbi:MAG TPA: histidine kinase [Thermoanaerobaculia bacterium]|nr:histidine kinase [Thermoanaerobaculia bacterium]